MELKKLLIDLFSGSSKDLLITLCTFLIAFLSWVVKELIEKPMASSKATFNKYLEKRIEILADIKIRLLIIKEANSPEANNYKEQLQTILLEHGKGAYLDNSTLAKTISIAIRYETDLNSTQALIDEINADMTRQIRKVQDEIQFYSKFSNFDPVKRIVSFLILSLQYVAAVLFSIALTFFIFYWLIVGHWYVGLLLFVSIVCLYLGANWWLKR
jgi:hypothetical protein